MIFYRFGEIPEDACSSIWNNNNEVIGKKPTEAEAKPKKAKMTANEIKEMALKCAK